MDHRLGQADKGEGERSSRGVVHGSVGRKVDIEVVLSKSVRKKMRGGH